MLDLHHRRYLQVALGLAVYAVFMANWWFEWLRFASPRLNYLFMSAVFLLPAIMLLLVLRFRERKQRITLSLIVLPVALSSAPFVAVMTFLMTVWLPEVIRQDADRSFEQMRHELLGEHRLVVYRTHAGVEHFSGIAVRRETEVLPGLLWVHRVCDRDAADSVRLSRLESEEIACTFVSALEALCETEEGGNRRDRCYAEAGREEPALCEKIQDPELERECRGESLDQPLR